MADSMFASIASHSNRKAGIQLLAAAKKGDVEECKSHVLSGANASDAVDVYQRSPLHYAAQNGHIPVIEYLIKKINVQPDPIDRQELTPLHLAAQAGKLDAVMLLVSLGADKNSITKMGKLASELAAAKGFSDVADFLDGKVVAQPKPKAKAVETAPKPAAASSTGAVGGDKARIKELELALTGSTRIIAQLESKNAGLVATVAMLQREIAQLRNKASVDLDGMDMKAVVAWLGTVGLGGKYDSAITDNEIDGHSLKLLSEKELVGDLGLSEADASKLRSLIDGGGDGATGPMIAWSVEQVFAWVNSNGMSTIAESLRSKGISGAQLASASVPDLKGWGLSTMEAAKLRGAIAKHTA